MLRSYLDESTEKQLRAAAEAAGMSVSRWVATAIHAKAGQQWPASVLESFGSWQDLPGVSDLRTSQPPDIPRDEL